MILGEFFIALVIALFFTIVLAVSGKKHRTWKRMIMIFLIILFSSWAGGVWITPIGPAFLGIYWLSFFIVALILSLILETVSTLHASPPDIDKKETRKEEESLEVLISSSFLILLIIFIIIIVIGYLKQNP
jgi:MFS family permease